MPPAPKEKKEKGPVSEEWKKRKQQFADVDYGRPYTTNRRRRRDPDDAEEGEVL